VGRACDYIMGCCQSASGAGRELARCCREGAAAARLPASAVGTSAPELSAYDFASEKFARAYLEQAVTPSADPRRSDELGDFIVKGSTPRKATTRRVPEDYATIQDALDAAQPGDVSGRAAAALLLLLSPQFSAGAARVRSALTP
jgi:hypothetical protein